MSSTKYEYIYWSYFNVILDEKLKCFMRCESAAAIFTYFQTTVTVKEKLLRSWLLSHVQKMKERVRLADKRKISGSSSSSSSRKCNIGLVFPRHKLLKMDKTLWVMAKLLFSVGYIPNQSGCLETYSMAPWFPLGLRCWSCTHNGPRCVAYFCRVKSSNSIINVWNAAPQIKWYCDAVEFLTTTGSMSNALCVHRQAVY